MLSVTVHLNMVRMVSFVVYIFTTIKMNSLKKFMSLHIKKVVKVWRGLGGEGQERLLRRLWLEPWA